MKTFFAKLHYSKISPLSLLLWPFSCIYGLIVFHRNYLYDKNILKTAKLPAYVVSIGNLTTGGTGKTPITGEIANYYLKKGKKVGIISRGYGGKLNIKNTNIISDGEKIYYNAEMAGDEPYWTAKNSPGTIVITGKNRVTSGKLAIERFGVEVLLLDDGFQHRKLGRDLDIVLVDSKKKGGNGFLLPAGPLREPEKNIKRAHKVILVNKYPYNEVPEHKNAYICRLTPEIPEGITTAAAFSGIAQPDMFFKALESNNIRLISKKVFPDHHQYTKKDVQNLLNQAEADGVEAIITTEKDMVKIEPLLAETAAPIPVFALKLKVELDTEGLLG